MDVDYLRLGLVVVVGVVLYYALSAQYNVEAANVLVLAYTLLSLRVYELFGTIQAAIPTPNT